MSPFRAEKSAALTPKRNDRRYQFNLWSGGSRPRFSVARAFGANASMRNEQRRFLRRVSDLFPHSKPGFNPDLTEFKPKKATYLIDQLREMQYSAVIQPSHGEKKIFYSTRRASYE